MFGGIPPKFSELSELFGGIPRNCFNFVITRWNPFLVEFVPSKFSGASEVFSGIPPKFVELSEQFAALHQTASSP